MQSFADFITHERERLHRERETISGQQHELETKLTDINRELAAIDAYEAAKTGKPAVQPRQRTTTGGRRSGIRDQVYDIVKAKASSPADVRAILGIADGDKSGSQSVANALSALKKAGKLTLNDGTYAAP
jgi:chromosome segregation ATPase